MDVRIDAAVEINQQPFSLERMVTSDISGGGCSGRFSFAEDPVVFVSVEEKDRWRSKSEASKLLVREGVAIAMH